MVKILTGGPQASIGDTMRYMATSDDGTLRALGRTERSARRNLRRVARRIGRPRHSL